MEFSNPFDNPQGQFYILQNAQRQFSLWPAACALPQAGTWYANRNRRTRASSGLIRAGQH